MKIAKCRLCKKTVQLEEAQQGKWKVDPNFDESIYGYYGICPDCKFKNRNTKNNNICKTLKDYVNICEDSSFNIKERYRMGFGKYRGLPLSQVPLSYYRWARTAVKEKQGWFCSSCGYRLGDKEPEEYAIECPRCGTDHEWGT